MNKSKTTIGRAETVSFPDLGLLDVPARIDSGAKTSSIWASEITEEDGGIRVVFLDGGASAVFKNVSKRAVASSNGEVQVRYAVRILVTLAGRRIRATFTLADRSSQAYPVLVGRNVLRGKFLVDVERGDILRDKERERSSRIQDALNKEVG